MTTHVQPAITPRPDRLRQAAAAAHLDPAFADVLDHAAGALRDDLTKWRNVHGEHVVCRLACDKYGPVLQLAGEVLSGQTGVTAA